ncbi:MAG: M23 family metallopeptidase [Desulfovibrio sp.]|nr:MAG: M23 family metallopeptidase [Desulfovibrio sp.]
MLFKKYKVFILQDKGRPGMKIGVWGFIPAFLALLLAVLTGSNIYLGLKGQSLEKLGLEVTMADLSGLEQQDELLDLAFRIKKIQRTINDIQDFDGKLRVMLSMEEEPFLADTGEGGSGEFYNLSVAMQSDRSLIRQMHKVIDSITTRMHMEEVHQQELMAEIVLQQDSFTRVPSIWPTQGRYSSPFGYRVNPVTGRRAFHKGIDITAPTGTPILASATGRITYADRFTSYGIVVEVNHGNGIMTRYAHMSQIAVRLGQRVARGDVIGYVGSTGRSTAPHLHYEVHVAGKLANPIHYILN